MPSRVCMDSGLAQQHVLSLGDYFILREYTLAPSLSTSDSHNNHSINGSCSSGRLYGFQLHIHITASNVLLLPERCDLPVRRLMPSDMDAASPVSMPATVKLSPFGIAGQLLWQHDLFRPISGTAADQQLDLWSTLHAIPLDVLRMPAESKLPLFVMVRVGSMLLSYPTALVFPLVEAGRSIADAAAATTIDAPSPASILRVSMRDPAKSSAWTYVDHCASLAAAVLAQCAAHEPTPLAEEASDNDEWKPVRIDTDASMPAMAELDTATPAKDEGDILQQLCGLFQAATPVVHEPTAPPSGSASASTAVPNDSGVVTPAATLGTLGDEGRRTSGLSALDGLSDFYNFDDPDTEMVTEDDFNFFDEGPVSTRPMESAAHVADAKDTMTMTDVLSNNILTAAAAAAVAATTNAMPSNGHALDTSALLADSVSQSVVVDMDTKAMDHAMLDGSGGVAADAAAHVDHAGTLPTPKDASQMEGAPSPANTTSSAPVSTTAGDAVHGAEGGSGALASPLSLLELRTALIPVEFAPLVDDATMALDAKYRHGGRYAYVEQEGVAETDVLRVAETAEERMPYTADYEPKHPPLHARTSRLPPPRKQPVDYAAKQQDSGKKKPPSSIARHGQHGNESDTSSTSSSSSSSDTDSDDDNDDDIDLMHWSDAAQIAMQLASPDGQCFNASGRTSSSSSSNVAVMAKLFGHLRETTWREFTWQALYALNLHALLRQSNVCTTVLEQGEEYAIVNMISQVAEKLFIQDESHKSPPRTHSTVRGQLTVKQLYELYESGQPQSKYGRYQVRKRTHKQGCIEAITDEPEVAVQQQEQALTLNATAIRFWEALRLEPYGGKKALVPVMLCPVGDAMETSARHMLKEISAVYEACLLGTHRAMNGLEVVPVILLPSMTGESMHDRQLRSLTAAFEKLGGQLPALSASDTSTIVIYVVNPFPDHFKHLLAICQCFEATLHAYRKRGLNAEQLALQIIPLQLISDPIQRATDHASVCKTLAFSAYGRAFQRVTRIDDHSTSTEDAAKETAMQVWRRSQSMVERWFNGPCSITIVRKGIMGSAEFEAWSTIFGDDSPQVVLACTADAPILRIQLPTDERCGGEPSNGSIKSHTALAPDAGLLMKTVVGEVYLVDVGHRLAVSDASEREAACPPGQRARRLLPLASGSLVWLPDAGTLPDASTCRLQVHLLRAPSASSTHMTLRELLLRYYALSFIHFSPNFAWAPLPVHLRVLHQLIRLVECQSTR
ncbi:hypothetical protein SYNPS1DRAFT_28520 [Syncephalis pseudoplumigaleata]|uniref:Mediator of RNA polymerase II transcription subunit 13 n=1 Tax=Syncephalis pseudoplumigaleata TaxID=1712513 RepID=A0A4V1J1P3_9FUNG|nr:hypothetical protein SYNPS1DRAFT_28520 [Syncephalis pseudoplumigaleata]|eukprot:RKP25759.1 hypothetical protein SYNPS1DRAFT_28520 [Syncephalis pseudoplumigaleata]